MRKSLSEWVALLLQLPRRPPGNIKQGIADAARLGLKYGGYYWKRVQGGTLYEVAYVPYQAQKGIDELPLKKVRALPRLRGAPRHYTKRLDWPLRQETTGRVQSLLQWARELDGAFGYPPGLLAAARRLSRAEKLGMKCYGSYWQYEETPT